MAPGREKGFRSIAPKEHKRFFCCCLLFHSCVSHARPMIRFQPFENEQSRQFLLSYTRLSGSTMESWEVASIQDAAMRPILPALSRLYGIYGAIGPLGMIGSWHYTWSLKGFNLEAVMPMSGDGNSWVEVS